MFSNTWKDYDFEDVWLSDECTFQLYRNKIKLWSSGSKRPQKGFPKFSPKVMVWGALSFKGFYLKIIENGTVNGQKYCEIVQDFILYANALFPNGWILEQDGATPHTCKKAMDFFNDNSVQFLQWPPTRLTLTQRKTSGQSSNPLLKSKILKQNKK